MKKKYQVFVSSTYTDLRNERQIAVQSILSAGHIPAGMELFSAGDESQWEVIKRWIDESDIYLLLLGGRYGSIHPEKELSYIELEYDYAIEQNKPVFALVMNEDLLDSKVKEFGQEVFERHNHSKYVDFKEKVLSKMCKFYEDSKDIRIAIYETLRDFEERYSLLGWVSGRNIPDDSELKREIKELRATVDTLKIEKRELLTKLTSNKQQNSQMVDSSEDVYTRVDRILKVLNFSDAEEGGIIEWYEGEEDNPVRKVIYGLLDNFTAYYEFKDNSKNEFEWITFVSEDDSLSLQTILSDIRVYSIKLPISDVGYKFIIISNEFGPIDIDKMKSFFSSLNANILEEGIKVKFEVWNEEQIKEHEIKNLLTIDNL